MEEFNYCSHCIFKVAFYVSSEGVCEKDGEMGYQGKRFIFYL